MKRPISSLKQWLTQGYCVRFQLEKKAFWNTLSQLGFDVTRCTPPMGKRADCLQLLQECKPYLDTLCPEPEGGWLAFFYES